MTYLSCEGRLTWDTDLRPGLDSTEQNLKNQQILFQN